MCCPVNEAAARFRRFSTSGHTARVRERMVRRQTLPVPRASLVIPDPRIEREIEMRQE